MAIYGATIVAIVAGSLLQGVVLGLLLSFAKLLYTFSHLRVRVEEVDGCTHVHLCGAATFLAIPKLGHALEAIPPEARAKVHFDALTYIDHACLDFLAALSARMKRHNGELVVEWDELEKRYHNAYENRRRASGRPGRDAADS